MKYSLKEIEKITGMSRRKIQEYEKQGLSRKPEQEKKKSHKLMYDNSHINDLYRLRFYHELDYKIPQIKKDRLTEISAIERNVILKEHIKEIEDKIKSLQKLVAIGKIMCEIGLEPADLMGSDTIIPFDELLKMLEIHELSSSSQEDTDKWIEKNVKPEKYEKFNTALLRLKQLYSVKMEINNDLVQSQLTEIYEALSVLFNNSPFIFMSTFSVFVPGSANGEEMDEDYGEGFTEFLYSALQYYYFQRKDNAVDKQIVNAFNDITQLYIIKGLPIDSDEVMNQVDIAYNFFAKIGYLSAPDIINSLKAFNRILFSDFFIQKLDENQQKGSRVAYIVILYAIDSYARNKLGINLRGE